MELEKNVIFLGFHDNPAGFLSNLDIFLLSSISEGFSIATIQAMASGLPVVATKSGGPEEIITHAKNGWLVEAGNPEAIAEGLEKLAGEHELCSELAKKGKTHTLETFGISTMIGSYMKIHSELL